MIVTGMIVTGIFVTVVVVTVVVTKVLQRRSPSVTVAEARARAEAEIWLHRTWRRVDGAIIRGQVKRDGLRLRRELRDEMGRVSE